MVSPKPKKFLPDDKERRLAAIDAEFRSARWFGELKASNEELDIAGAEMMTFLSDQRLGQCYAATVRNWWSGCPVEVALGGPIFVAHYYGRTVNHNFYEEPDDRWPDWPRRTSSHILLFGIEYARNIMAGLDAMIPPDSPYAALSSEGRFWLFLHLVWRRSTERPRELPMLKVVWYLTNSKAFAEEWARRFGDHAGVWAATFVGASQAEARGEYVSAREYEEKLNALRRVSWKHIGFGVQDELKSQQPNSPGWGNLRRELNSYVTQKVLKRWGSADMRDLAARSLDGELDIAPEAIGNRTTKDLLEQNPAGKFRLTQNQASKRRRNIEIEFVDAATLPELDTRPVETDLDTLAEPDAPEAQQTAPNQAAAKKRDILIARYSSEVEETQRALEAADGNMAEAARQLGISRPALYKRLAKYKHILTL